VLRVGLYVISMPVGSHIPQQIRSSSLSLGIHVSGSIPHVCRCGCVGAALYTRCVVMIKMGLPQHDGEALGVIAHDWNSVSAQAQTHSPAGQRSTVVQPRLWILRPRGEHVPEGTCVGRYLCPWTAPAREWRVTLCAALGAIFLVFALRGNRVAAGDTGWGDYHAR
jgi:hypothetical protein